MRARARDEDYPFISRGEAQKFQEQYGRYPREVNQVNPLKPQQLQQPPQELRQLIAKELGMVLRSEKRFACRVISVMKGDGTSWSATATDQVAASRQFRGLRRLHLRGVASLDDIPEIIGLMSPREFARLARKYSSSWSFVIFAPWTNVVLAAAAIGLAAIVEVAKALAKPVATLSPAALLDAWVIGPAVVVAAGGLALKYVLGRLAYGNRADLPQVVQKVTSAADPKRLENFAEDVAQWLEGDCYRRLLIVDQFNRLDRFTKDVLVRYLRDHVTTQSNELWVIFDAVGGGETAVSEFQRSLVPSLVAGRFTSVLFYKQAALSAEARQRLAGEAGDPERGRFETVKAVVREIDDATFDAFERLRSPADAARYGPLELFYLLAVDSGWDGQWTMSEKSLEGLLADRHKVRFEVLQAALPGGTLHRNELDITIRKVREQFRPWIDSPNESPQNSDFAIHAEAAEWLAEHRDRYGLIDPRLAHLFWTLLWHDKLGNHPPEAFWINKLASHIVKSSAPKDLGDFSAAVTFSYFDAIRFAATACLRESLVDRVPILLGSASDLVDTDDAEHREAWRKRGRLLRSLCWQCYAITGDDRVLSTIDQLQRRLGVSRSVAAGAQDPLEAMYLQSIGVTGPARWNRDQAAIMDYGRLRSAWLLLTARPFTVKGTSLLSSSQALPDLLDASWTSSKARLERLDMGDAVNWLSAILFLWCSALRFSAQHWMDLRPPSAELTLDLMESIALQVLDKEPVEGRREGKHARDFFADGCATELLVLVRVVALALRNRQDAMAGDPSAKAAADQLLFLEDGEPAAWADLSQEQRQRLRDEITHRLELIPLMWEALGFHQLAMMSRLRRVQFDDLLDGRRGPEEWKVAMNRLGEAVDTPGFVGLLANLIIARTAAQRAVALYRLKVGVKMGIDAGMAPPLISELSFLVVRHGHSFQQNFDAFLQELLRSDGSRRSGRRLAAILNAVDDADVGDVAMALLNAARRTRERDVREGIVKELELRIKDPAPTLDTARQELELFRLDAAIQAGDAVDVDEILGRWKGWTPSWKYDWLMVLLFGAGTPHSPMLVEEATRVLRQRAKEPRLQYNSPLILACRVATERPEGPLNPDAIPAAISLLKDHHPLVEFELAPTTNIEILSVLSAYDPANSQGYRARQLYWQSVSLQTDFEGRTLDLAGQGRFFLVLYYYFDTLRFWGIPLDLSIAEWAQRLQTSPGQQRDVANEWIKSGREIPHPFVNDGINTKFSADFLWLGWCLNQLLTGGDSKNRSNAAEIMKGFDLAAQNAMPHLYRLVAESSSVPRVIASILAAHEKKLSRYTLPAEVSETRRPITRALELV